MCPLKTKKNKWFSYNKSFCLFLSFEIINRYVVSPFCISHMINLLSSRAFWNIAGSLIKSSTKNLHNRAEPFLPGPRWLKVFIIKQLDVRKHLWVSRVTSWEFGVEIFGDVLPVYTQLNDTILQLNFPENINNNNSQLRWDLPLVAREEGDGRRQFCTLICKL